MVMWLLLLGCASRPPAPTPATAAPPPGISSTLSDAERSLLVQAEAPEATTLAPVPNTPSALAPILQDRRMTECDPASSLCAAVSCDVANRMASGFPSRWSFWLSGPGRRESRENVRWILSPGTSEVRTVALPLAPFLTAECSASEGVQTTARATVCDGRVDCVDVVCSAWSASGATAYVDAHLQLPDGSTVDHDAVPVSVPVGGDVVQTTLRYTADSEQWHPGRPVDPPELSLTPHCAYWDGNSPIEPLPQ